MNLKGIDKWLFYISIPCILLGIVGLDLTTLVLGILVFLYILGSRS